MEINLQFKYRFGLLIKTDSKNRQILNRGITLLETMIYVTLLSFLLAGFIQYAYIIHEQNFLLFNEIQDEQNQ